MNLPIYLDYNATTPVDARVLEAMTPYLTTEFGNAASKSHAFGWRAEAAVETAREQVAALIGAAPREVVWTSGATESNNLAIKGAAEMYRDKGRHIITCRTEHRAVLDPCRRLAEAGWDVTFLGVDAHGLLDPQRVADAITDGTVLVSVMAANNEIGTIHPVAEIGRLCKARGVLFHCDATQAVGKVAIDADEMGIDLLSASGHKIYGPKGIGCLYVRRRSPRVRLTCQMDGGGHERGMRSGTLNVPGIVGFGAAAEICQSEMAAEAERLTGLRDRLHAGITDRLEEVRLNGHPTERLPNTLNLSFAYVEGEALMMKLKNLAVSSGSACTSESRDPSHVLTALAVPENLVNSSLRFSLGRGTTQEEIDYAVEHVTRGVTELRELSPLYELAREGGRPPAPEK
ncbi:MAG: IscS subfamily cysteine desulfurase [Phycisphaerae bacterium]